MRTKEKFCICSKCMDKLSVTVTAGNRTAGKVAMQMLDVERRAKGWQCINPKFDSWYCGTCVKFAMGIYDSETGESVTCQKLVVVDELELQYSRVTRGPIVQVVHFFEARHYFYQENVGRLWITQDEESYGVDNLLDLIDEHAP